MKIDFNNARCQLAYAYERLVNRLNSGIENDKVTVFVEDIEPALNDMRGLISSIGTSYIEGCPDFRELSDKIGTLVVFNDQEEEEGEDGQDPGAAGADPDQEDRFTHPGPAYSYAADTIMSAIKKDVVEGKIPNTVSSYSELHDYVDANDYLDLIFPHWDIERDTEHANSIMDLVDSRIKSGELSTGG